MPRDATGVRQNKSPHTTMCEIKNSSSSTRGIGNQFQRSCRMVTVGLYTARKPVEVSSRICSANATHRANHALPKPDAESAGEASFMESPVTEFSITGQILAIENPHYRAHRWSSSTHYRVTSLISASKLPSESRKKVIHKSCVGIFAIMCGSSSKCTLFSFSFPYAD